MLCIISANPVFEKWLDGIAIRRAERGNSLRPTKNAASWYYLAEADETDSQIDELDTATQTEP